MNLRNEKQLGRVSHLPVTQLVGKHGLNLLGVRLLDQRVVDDNLLLPWQASEVGIAVGAALAAVNDLQFREREVEALGKSFDSVFERTGLERGKLVEQRNNDDGVDSNSEELDTESEQPEIVEELVTSLLNDLQESPAKRDTKGQRECLSLEQVGHPQADSLLVEAELLFEDEVVVV